MTSPERAGSAAPASRTTVLVVDDEPAFQQTIERYLERFRRLTAYSAAEARRQLRAHHVDVVLLDLNLPDMNGIELLPVLLEYPSVVVLVMTAHTELTNAVACVKAGAFDFLAKDYENYVRLEHYIERALRERRRHRADLARRAGGDLAEWLALLACSRSREMQEALDASRVAAPLAAPMLLEGERGSGRELVARYVHQQSARAGPFVVVRAACRSAAEIEAMLFGRGRDAAAGAAALGALELAEGGTLFLADVDQLDEPIQRRLAAALAHQEILRPDAREPTPIDVRLIAATTEDLERAVQARRFRPELAYWLRLGRVVVPPLRRRPEDIEEMLDFFARRAAQLAGRPPPRFSPCAIDALRVHPWPGNVRELEALVARLVWGAATSEIDLPDLPIEYTLDHMVRRTVSAAAEPGTSGLLRDAVEQFERQICRGVLARYGGNVTRAARALGVAPATLKAKVDER